jgi:predicted esterase
MLPALVLAGAVFALGPDGEIGAFMQGPVTSAPGGRLDPAPRDTRAPGAGWSVVGPGADGVVDLGTTRNGARALAATLVCAAPFEGFLELGSDDGLAVWVDDTLVHAADRPRGFRPDADFVPVRWAPGRHRVLVEVANVDGAWRFAARLHALDHGPPVGVTGEVASDTLPPAPRVAPPPPAAPIPLGPAPEPAPVALRPGVQSVTLRTLRERDGRLRPYIVSLPATPPPPTGYPTVVLLHGFQQGPEPLVRMLAADPGAADVAIIAPHGHGDIVFRGPGEQDVLDALAFLGARVPVDPERIWLTGVSMGGMAAFELAVRHPDVFAAVAPICGASDWRLVWRLDDTKLMAWERVLVDAGSPVGLAENGPPMFCVHGSRDRVNPMQNSVPFVQAYRKLRKTFRFETPPLGHEVWPWAYGTGRMFSALRALTREKHADDVVLRTPSVGMTPARHAWLGIEAVRTVGPAARATAERRPSGRLRVRTENTRALRLDIESVPTVLDLDRHRFAINAAGPQRFHFAGGHWRIGGLPAPGFPGPRRPGLAGPADAVYSQDVRIVYGTAEPGAVGHLKALAEHLARYRDGSDLALPVIPDTAVGDRTATALILVGTPAQNPLVAEVLPDIPLRIERDAIRLGGQTVRGAVLGALVGYPDPKAPGRPLLLVTGNDLRGVVLAWSLPELVPDYLVYDAGLVGRTRGKVLGERSVRLGGFFGPDWEGPPGRRAR